MYLMVDSGIFLFTLLLWNQKKKIIVMAELKCIIFTKFQSLVQNILKIGFKSH